MVMASHFAPSIGSTGNYGSWAVQFFFVLSGFLIGRILFKAREVIDSGANSLWHEISNFFVRRSIRIFPPYYALLVACVVLGNWSDCGGLTWSFFYAINLWELGGGDSGVFGHLYTLAIEEQFYIFFPWLLLCVPRRYLSHSLWTMIIIACLYRLVCMDLSRTIAASRQLPAALDAFAFGALAASSKLEKTFKLTGITLLYTNAIWVSCGGLYFLTYYIFKLPACVSYVIFNIFAAGVVMKLWDGIKLPFISHLLEFGPLVYLGQISYGVYLYHNFMGWFTTNLFLRLDLLLPGTELGRFFLYSTFSISLASLSWHLLERPLNSLKRYFP